MTFVHPLTGVAPVLSLIIALLFIKHGRSAAVIASLLILAGGITAAPRSETAASLKLEIKVVDSVTGAPRSKYFLGETVSVVFTVTNLGRRARIIGDPRDIGIPYELVSMFENEDTETSTGWGGGRGHVSSVERSNGNYWIERAPLEMTLPPGQSVSGRIDDLRGEYHNRLADGKHRLSATYGKLTAVVSFQVVVDKAKSIAWLEKMAATPAPNGDENERRWATLYLEEIRNPSLSGRVTDTAGKPLKDVRISVTGPEDTHHETGSNGRYHLNRLIQGRTYTLTPSLDWEGSFSAKYTFEPASRTITNLNSKLTGLNFKATRVRQSVNVADEDEGATARASSTLSAPDDKFEANDVIDGNNTGQWDNCCDGAWTDATPNIYPDWVEIKFKGPRAIDWINVFSPQDQPFPSPDPTLTETFTKRGITDFDVQYWNGRAWRNVPGGVIRDNRNVWRKIAFPTITTNKIRVVVRKALSGYSRIMEIEAFHINESPVVKLTGRSEGRTGSSFQFHANAADKDSAIHKYTLDYGDGSPNYELEFGYKSARRELNLTHTHTYTKAGTYTVTLRAIDHDDEGSETAMTVTVADAPTPPVAEAAGPYQGVAGNAVSFEGRASSDPDGKIVRYRWNFGDGKSGTGATASHKYAASGRYKVTLIVVDSDGLTAIDTAHVLIAAAPLTLR